MPPSRKKSKAVGWIANALSWAVVIAAPATILLQGYQYGWKVYQSLLSPGVPIEYRLKTPGGEVAIYAENYRIDTQGPVHVDRAVVKAPDGSVLASVRSLDLDGRKLVQSGGKSIDIAVAGLKGELRRGKDGRLNLIQYLPEQKGPAEDNPFKVRVDGAEVSLVDLAGKVPFIRTLKSDRLYVDGIGENWVAGGTFTVGEFGASPVWVQNRKSRGLQIRTNLKSAELGPLVEHLRSTPEGKSLEGLQPLRARSLVATGSVRLTVAPDGSTAFEGDLRAQAADIRYADTDFESATFAGYLNLDRAEGTFAGRRESGRFDLVGALDWQNGFRAGGQTTIQSQSPEDIPPSLRQAIPSDLKYRGMTYHGWLSFSEEPGLQLQGNATVAQLNFRKEIAEAISGPIALSQRLLRANLALKYQGIPASGSIAYYPKTAKLEGWVRGAQVPLAQLARLLPASSRPTLLSGTTDVTASFDGPISTLSASVVASATGMFAMRDLPQVQVRKFGLVADYSQGKLLIRRMAAETNFGNLAGFAALDPASGKLSGEVLAADIGLAAFDRTLSGRGIAKGTVSGTLQRPLISGDALVLGLRVADQSVPVAKSTFALNTQRLALTKLSAVQESGRLDGQLALNFADRRLSGSGQVLGIPLDVYAPEAQGLIDITRLQVGGTATKPVAAFRAEGDEILLGDELVESLRAEGRFEGQTLRLLAAKIGFAGSEVRADGDYNLNRKRGVFTLTGDALSLPKVNAVAKLPIPLTGAARFKLIARGSGDVWALAGDGRVDKVTIDGTPFGDGLWTVGGTTNRLTASAQLGSLERYLQLDDVVIEPKERKGSGTLIAYRNQLQDYYLAARKKLGLDFETESALNTMTGVLDADVKITYDKENLSLSASMIAASDLTIREKRLGDLKAIADYRGEQIHVTSLDFTGPAGALTMKGDYDASGEVVAEGNLDGFDLSTLGLFRREFARLNGKADVAFVASGRAKNPNVQASIFASQDLLQTATDAEGAPIETKVPLYLELAPITIGPVSEAGGGLSLEGKLRYRTFEAKLLGTVPFDLAAGIDENREVALRMTVEADLMKAEQSGLLDPSRTAGVAKGVVTLVGPKSDLRLVGDLSIVGAQLGVVGMRTGFEKLDGNIHFEDGSLRATARAAGSLTGELAADITWQLPEIQSLLRTIAAGETAALLATPLSGTLSANAFAFNEESKEYGAAKGQIEGDIKVSGTPLRPVFTGPVTFSGIDLKLPEVALEVSESKPLPFDPAFDMALAIKGTARASTSMAKFGMTGNGVLKGSLSEPDFSADLRIQSGELKLPTARITVEPGGAVRPSYRSSFGQVPEFRLDVDIEGRTSVTAAKYGDTVERYDVNLRIRGDLLEDGALTFTATSDPADLSQDRILALLGRADLIEGLAGGFGRSSNSQLRQAVATFALPIFLEPITRQLANGLGLESISLDYDPGDVVSVSFAKVLGKGLVLTGSRQISEALPGLRQRYEYKISYRIPVRRRGFDRYRLVLGTDQLTPWKFGIEYSTRFGNVPASQTSKRRILSGPKDEKSRKVN
jgi:autotransporter translocation and assembly factor TamB